MTIPTFLSGTRVWKEIKRLAADTAGPRSVAVAYVGVDSTGALNLQRGDAIHCALSLRNARAGVVCPGELVKLRKAGVRIYADEHLHAKVYLFGRAAVVGSANVSQRSQKLAEAAVVVRESRAIRAIQSWFEEREDEEVSDLFLTKCNDAYRPPTWNPFMGGKNPRMKSRVDGAKKAHSTSARPRNDTERWWLLWNMGPTTWDDETEAVAIATTSKAKQRVPPSRWRALCPILWVGRGAVMRDLRKGDKIVCTEPSGSGQALLPWGTCHAFRRWTTPHGTIRLMMSVEFPESDAALAYGKFVARARAAGLPISARGESRFYDDPEHVRILRSLSSPRALARR